MKAFDTNAVIRYLVRDDEVQAQAVRGILISAAKEDSPVCIPTLVALEVIWVLSSSYGFCREDIITAFENLLALPEVRFENPDTIADFCLAARRVSGELADILIGVSAMRIGCAKVLTFDRRASKMIFFEAINK